MAYLHRIMHLFFVVDCFGGCFPLICARFQHEDGVPLSLLYFFIFFFFFFFCSIIMGYHSILVQFFTDWYSLSFYLSGLVYWRF